MSINVRVIIQQKLAKLLDHLYFQEAKSTINVTIILLFFVQKLNLIILFSQSDNLKEQELYFNVFGQALTWITFQKPLRMLNLEIVQTIITLLYTALHLVMFFVFCFSLYKWQFIKKIFTFYISYFQLIVLYHTQIHILTQKYQYQLNILISIPLYINYGIIAYCSRNYFILSQNILRRYSIYNYLIMLIDYLTFILFSVTDNPIRQFIILFLFLVYFCDSFFFRPYCQIINNKYVLATSVLAVVQIVKIVFSNFQICDQIYTSLIFAPLISVVIILFTQNKQQQIQSSSSLESAILLGEFINNSQQNQISRYFGKSQLSSTQILQQLMFYADNLTQEGNNSAYFQYKEEIQLYLIFLSYNIKGSYLLCLLQAKQFQIKYKKHSLFFKVIADLISQKYDRQVENFVKTETTQIENNHQKLIQAREFQQFYINNIDSVCDILDEKIRIWNKILQGFKRIDDALNQVVKLHKQINELSLKHTLIRTSKNRRLSHSNMRNQNLLTLRYLSFFYSYVENNLLKSLKIEKQIGQLMNQERDKISTQTINISLLKNDIAIISASILENKGAIMNSDTQELNVFFGLEFSSQKFSYINQLMPNFIQENHSDYIDKFISSGVSDLYNKSKSVFGQDGEGYILPIDLSFLHLNEKSNDFILTAILQKNQLRCKEIILFQNDGKIIGISKNIYQQIFRTNTRYIQQIDVKIYNCFVQFWIPSVIQYLQNQNNEQQELIQKQIVDVFILEEISLNQDKIFAENSPQENHLTAEMLTQSIQQYYLSTDKTLPQKIQLEAEFQRLSLPDNRKFYCLSFSNFSQEILLIQSQDNIINLKSPNNQKYELEKRYLQGEELLSTKKVTDIQQLSLFKESNQQFKLENLDSQFLNFTSNQQDHLKDDGIMSFQTKKKIFNYSAQSQSSQQSTNSNMQVYEVIKQIVHDKGYHKYVKQIFLVSIFLLVVLVLFQAVILKTLSDQNLFLEDNVQLIHFPDKFNRLYCSFTTMGQLDVERSILGQDVGNYGAYRIKELSTNLREQMEVFLPSLRQQFSNLEIQNRLPQLNVRVINFFSYQEELMGMMQFNFLVEATTDILNQEILSNFQYQGEDKIKVIDLYYQEQFLKGNLINQIKSTQSLIDGIVEQINYSSDLFFTTMKIYLIVMLVLILYHTLLIAYFWRKSYQSIKLMIQLVSFSSDLYIFNSIDRTKYGKQLIKGYTWKQVNYFSANFNTSQYRSNNSEDLYLLQLKNKNNQGINFRINHQQFQFKIVYLKILVLMILILSGCLANYLYITETSISSFPEMNLTLEYVQFKQNWDSLMILSYLLKTNRFTASKALELGFLDKNYELKNSSLYFHTLYVELVQSFSETVPKIQSYNPKIFSGIENSQRMLEADKSRLINLYENDLCVELLDQLPFCSFIDGKFTYFPDYPDPLPENNNRDIFKGGINGLFQKILLIFQSGYQLEILNTLNTNNTDVKLFITSQDFNLYILQYYFDINKAVVVFYQTVLGSITNLLKQDTQNIFLFCIIIFALILIIYLFILLYFLFNIEYLIRASKSSLNLLPSECLAESKCHMIIKKYKNEN